MNKKIEAIIIEDEERTAIVLQALLESYCPDVEIVGSAKSVQAGTELIRTTQPDLVFMDIQIIGGTGFDILDKFPDFKPALIFTTAYDQYAVKAFKFSAIDYLLKPIDIDELKHAVQRTTARQSQFSNQLKVQNLLENIKREPNEDPVILISTMDSINFIPVKEIIRIEAHSAYSKFYLENGESLLVSKVMKEFDQLLSEYSFFRVHQSHLINLRFIKKFLKAHHCFEMIDGSKIQLARSRKEQVFEALKRYHPS